MNEQDLFSTPEFNRLHPVKQQIIREVVKNNQHTSPEAMLPKILSINKELTKRNLNFTKEESNLLINIMKENMTPAERQKEERQKGFGDH